MSNPFRPLSNTDYVLTDKQKAIDALMPQAIFDEQFLEVARKKVVEYSNLKAFQVLMLDSKMTPTSSVYIPKHITINGVSHAITTDTGILNKVDFDPLIGVLYSIPGGNIQERKRTFEGGQAALELYQGLHDDVQYDSKHCLFGTTKEGCAVKAKGAMFIADAPPAASMGRILKHYPKRGERTSIHFTVPSYYEAQDALERCGLVMPDTALVAKHLFAPAGMPQTDFKDYLVSVNPDADCGLPILGKLRGKQGVNAEARYILGALNRYMYDELDRAYQRDSITGVDQQMKKWAREQPYLVAAVGKTKPDYYSLEKVMTASLRFYNVVPKQIGMIMSIASQPFEAAARSIFEGSNSAQGITLSKGGTDRLMAGMRMQLEKHNFAYVHCGDDSFVIYQIGERLYVLSVDMTAFDLTQRGDVMRQVDNVIAEQLCRVDPVSGQMWLSYMREHTVVLNKTATYVAKDGGPSGVQLQSKRNDVIMDIVLNRLKMRFTALSEEGKRREFGSREAVDVTTAEVCLTLGFKSCRTEDFVVGDNNETLEQLFSRVAFKFIGYFIHYRFGHFVPMADIARQYMQMQFPGVKWIDKKELGGTEAARIGSIAFNFGVPTLACERAVEALVDHAKRGLEVAIAKYGDTLDSRLGFVTSASVYGATTPASLRGLLTVLCQDRMLHWGGTVILRLPRSLYELDDDAESPTTKTTPAELYGVDDQSEDDTEVFYLSVSDSRKMNIVVRQSAVPIYASTSAGTPHPRTQGTQVRESLRAQAAARGLNVSAPAYDPNFASTTAKGRRKMQGRELRADEHELQMYYDAQFADEDDDSYRYY